MNREQKAAVIDEIAAEITASQAIFAVDYRGISVAQADQLRSSLRQADAVFRVVKNSLTERAAQQAGAEPLLELLAGPTALTFVRGDAAAAAKAVADFTRTTQLLAFKGGVMDGAALSASDVGAISRLPSRDVLYGQLVGLVASPLAGLARTLNALIGGLAVGLGGVLAQKESDPAFAGALSAAVADDAGAPEASPAATGAEDVDASAEAALAGPDASEEAGDSAGAESPERPAADDGGATDASPAAAGAEDAGDLADSALAGTDAAAEAAVEEPAAEEPAAEEPAAEEPAADGAASAEPAAAEPARAEAAVDGAASAETPAEEPAAEQTLAEEVAAEDPVVEDEPEKDSGDALETTTTETEAAADPAAATEAETEGAAPEAPSGDDDKEDQ